MPQYFFDFTRDGELPRDESADFKEARAQAQVVLPDLNKEHLPDGELHRIRCDVCDEASRTVYRGEITFQGTRDPD